VSPDGGGAAAPGPEDRVELVPLDRGEPQALPELQPDDRPARFSSDGRVLFCVRSGMTEAAFLAFDLAGRKVTEKTVIHPSDPVGIVSLWPTDVTPDGRRYLYTYTRILSDLVLAEGLR
jgi:hypothetical protein